MDNEHSSEPVDRFLAVTMVFVISFLIASLFIPVDDADARVYGMRSRDSLEYSAEVDGYGPDSSICLLGHRSYNLSFTLVGVIPSDLEFFNLTFREDPDIVKVMTNDIKEGNLTQLEMSSILTLDGFEMFREGPNTTCCFFMTFHMNWDFSREFSVRPSVVINGTSPSMDALEQLRIILHGSLEPSGMSITDFREVPLEPEAFVGANGTITLSGLRFEYWHADEELDPLISGKYVMYEEVQPVIMAGDDLYNCSWDGNGFNATILTPEVLEGELTLTMDIMDIEGIWLTKVLQWRFDLNLDGMEPRIDLKYPLEKEKLASTDLRWELTVTDLPQFSETEVDGSSLSIRIYKEGSWSDWSPVAGVPDGKRIDINDTMTAESGNSTLIKFRVSDVLGNQAVSEPFRIHVNVPPSIDLPSGIDGSVYNSDQRFEMDAYGNVTDPDDAPSELNYEWYLDDMNTKVSDKHNISKALFGLNQGEHTFRLLVSDGFERDEVYFNITVNVVEEDTEDTGKLDFLTDQMFLTIAIPIVVLVLVVVIVIIFIVVSKKVSRGDDFVIDEDKSMSATQAEDMAKKLRELYEETVEVNASSDDFGNEAEIDDSGFDFDYDLYEVLDLDKNATDKEIKKAYRRKAAYFHPDRVAMHKEVTVEEAMDEIIKVNKAKEILLDPVRRSEYDQFSSESDFTMDIGADEDEDWD